MCRCTPVNGPVGIEKKHHECKLQVMTTMSVGYIFALVNDAKKYHQHNLQRVKTVVYLCVVVISNYVVMPDVMVTCIFCACSVVGSCLMFQSLCCLRSAIVVLSSAIRQIGNEGGMTVTIGIGLRQAEDSRLSPFGQELCRNRTKTGRRRSCSHYSCVQVHPAFKHRERLLRQRESSKSR